MFPNLPDQVSGDEEQLRPSVSDKRFWLEPKSHRQSKKQGIHTILLYLYIAQKTSVL